MKAVCIIGSPRNDGSTALIVDSFIKGLIENEFSVKRYCLGMCKINYCLGCKKCYIDGKCVQKDDVEKIVRDICGADIVLIASPSYWGDITGQLKVFFDRNTPYGDTNENRITYPCKAAYGISVSLRAGRSEKENIHILESIEHYYGHLGITPVGRLEFREIDTVSDLKNQAGSLEKAYLMGKNILNLLH